MKENSVCFLRQKKQMIVRFFLITPKLVSLLIFHTGTWNSVKGEFILNSLWNNFKLPSIGWKEKCKVLNYDNIADLTYLKKTQYFFKQKDGFLLNNLFRIEFATYDNKYEF